MLSKSLFFVIGFIITWAGLLMMGKCYLVPGVLVMGVGLNMFRLILDREEVG